MLNAVRKPYLYRSSIPSKLTACTSRYRGTAVLRAGRAGFTKKSLHLTFQSVQRGTIDGDAAPPIPKLLKDDIEPRAKRFPATKGHRGENPRKRNNRKIRQRQREETGRGWAYETLEPYSA